MIHKLRGIRLFVCTGIRIKLAYELGGSYVDLAGNKKIVQPLLQKDITGTEICNNPFITVISGKLQCCTLIF